MEKEIIELVQKCKLVHKKSVENGHDCWGKTEYTTIKYVIIDGKQKECFDNWYVIHDGKNVKEVCTKFLLDIRKRELERNKKEQEFFENTGFRTQREFDAYLLGISENINSVFK